MTPREQVAELQSRMEASVIGQADVIRQMIIGLLANGHLLLYDEIARVRAGARRAVVAGAEVALGPLNPA